MTRAAKLSVVARGPHDARGRPRRAIVAAGCALLALIAAAAVFLALDDSATPPSPRHARAFAHSQDRGTSTSTVVATTTTTTSQPPPASAGFVPGRVTAVGDSVMLDYQGPLQADIPGISVNAAVSRQWSDGESVLQTLKSEGQLGADVIVALGTNGPITDADFNSMMSILAGASRVVFVNVHVDRPWQDPNNAVLLQGAAQYPNAVMVNWNVLADQNPQWFGPDGTHLAINGPGADALAALVSSALTDG